MSTKKAKREAAQKKAKKKRMIILAAFAACVVAIVVFAVLVNANRPNARVFSVADQSVTLYEDGNFTARLAHGVSISGTFTEQVSGDVTTISFTRGGDTVSTQIANDVLLIPIEWRAGCAHGHTIELPLRR